MKHCRHLLLAAGVAASPMLMAQSEAAADDQYLWLEDVEGDKALDWVRARNAVSEKQLAEDPGFEKVRQNLLDILVGRHSLMHLAQLF